MPEHRSTPAIASAKLAHLIRLILSPRKIKAKIAVDGSFELRVRFDILAYCLDTTPAEVSDGAMNALLDGPPADLEAKLADAKARGSAIIEGGEVPDGPGYFLPVSIVDNPPENSRIVQEEQFGPIVPLLRFDDVDEVVERANAGDYGLGASVWSADLDKARAIAAWEIAIQNTPPDLKGNLPRFEATLKKLKESN